MMADVVFHELRHEAIDRPARGGEALEHVGASFVLIQSTLGGFELTDNLLRAIQEIEFFSGNMRHGT